MLTYTMTVAYYKYVSVFPCISSAITTTVPRDYAIIVPRNYAMPSLRTTQLIICFVTLFYLCMLF